MRAAAAFRGIESVPVIATLIMLALTLGRWYGNEGEETRDCDHPLYEVSAGMDKLAAGSNRGINFGEN